MIFTTASAPCARSGSAPYTRPGSAPYARSSVWFLWNILLRL